MLYRMARRRRDEEVNRHNGQTMEKNCVECKQWKVRAAFPRKGLYYAARCSQCMIDYWRKRRVADAGRKAA